MDQDRKQGSDGWAHAATPGSLPFPTTPPPLPPKWSAPAADAPLNDIWRRLDPEKIRCTGSSCGDALHCFRLTKQLAKVIGPGTCRACKKALISMRRVAQQDLSDADYTFSALQLEYVRHYFWHVPFSQKALDQALRAARAGLQPAIAKRVRQRIGDAEPYHDGWQTPTTPSKATAFDYAMHAVAACCRVCAEYWHGIPKGRPLTEEEVTYLGELMRRYLVARLPGLEEEPPRVPSIAAPSNVHDINHRISSSIQSEGMTRPHAS